MRVRNSASRKKAPNAETSSDKLSEQTAAFLKTGGKVQKIPSGKSGQQNISYFRRSNAR